jgi:hypothetical protein
MPGLLHVSFFRSAHAATVERAEAVRPAPLVPGVHALLTCSVPMSGGGHLTQVQKREVIDTPLLRRLLRSRPAAVDVPCGIRGRRNSGQGLAGAWRFIKPLDDVVLRSPITHHVTA